MPRYMPQTLEIHHPHDLNDGEWGVLHAGDGYLPQDIISRELDSVKTPYWYEDDISRYSASISAAAAANDNIDYDPRKPSSAAKKEGGGGGKRGGGGRGPTYTNYAWAFMTMNKTAENAYANDLRSRRAMTVQEAMAKEFTSQKRKHLRQKLGKFVRSGDDSGGVGQECQGEELFRMFLYILYQALCWKFKKFQVGFVKEIIKSQAKSLIGAREWEVCGERMIEELKMGKSPCSVVMATAPRRYGKTVVLACVQCARAMVKGGDVQATFATVGRATAAIRDLMRKTMETSGFGDMLMTKGKNAETVYVFPMYGTILAVLNYFPSNAPISIPCQARAILAGVSPSAPPPTSAHTRTCPALSLHDRPAQSESILPSLPIQQDF